MEPSSFMTARSPLRIERAAVAFRGGGRAVIVPVPEHKRRSRA